MLTLGRAWSTLMHDAVEYWVKPLSADQPVLERQIVRIRWLGALLCLVLVPFLGMQSVVGVYWWLLAIIAYNSAFSRLVRIRRPAWLLRMYVYGFFDTVAASAMVALTGGLTSPFFSAFFLIVVHAGIRFGRNAALLTVGVITICNVLLLHAIEGAGAALTLRLGFILLTALFAGILSDRTRVAEQAVADQLRRTQALHVAGAALAGTISWPDILPLVAQQARCVTAAEIAILDIRTEGEDAAEQRVTDVLPAGAYLAKQILHHRRSAPKAPLAAAHASRSTLAEATDLFGEAAQVLPPVSVLRAPIMLQRRWAGDLLLARTAGRSPFVEADVAILDAFIAQATLALENAALYQRVQVQAATDSLTGLPNHRSLKERLDDELLRARRQQRKLTVLMLDIDYFKPFNDDFGHAAGDAALQTVAAVLKSATRRGTTIARYGGEEFVVMLPDTDTDEGEAIAQRICRYVAESADTCPALPRRLTVSIGVASFPAHGEQRDALLQAADLAMYVAKRLGRDQVCSASELGTTRGAEALVAQLTEHLPISTHEWGPHIVTALERRFLRLATLEPVADRASADDAYQWRPVTLQWVTALAAAIDAKDHYTNGHSEQVAKLAVDLAQATGQSRELVELVRFAGQMHDIGKIGVPESILHKPGPLTPEEWAIMRVHPNIGARILSPIATLQPAIPIVLHHHERWDGQGYPDGLAGEAIPLGARMIAICDAFDTMVSDRPYRRALSAEDALTRLRDAAGSQFDPRLVEAFAVTVDVAAVAAG